MLKALPRLLLAVTPVLMVALTMVVATPSRAAARAGSTYEKQFLVEMISHHGMAVDMAKMAQEKATHAPLKQVAASIIRNQSLEIKQMQAWLKRWYGVSASPMMDHEMMSQMSELDAATGSRFEIRFLALMSVHHAQAIERAKEARLRAPHAQVRALARNIITAQNREVNTFRGWLVAWYAK